MRGARALAPPGVLALVLIAGAAAAQTAQPPAPPVPQPAGPSPTAAPVTVVAVSPLGGGVDVTRIAGEIQTFDARALEAARAPATIATLVGAEAASVGLDQELGTPFQPDFDFRGFEASPISGVAEGISVYQEGVRLNEAFGDGLNWDLVPAFAVKSLTLQSDNPVFGLNALGGAVTLAMKDGLDFDGLAADVSGGSFGDLAGHAEAGGRAGDFGFYGAVGGLTDAGFRDHSPAALRQAFGDLAWAHGPLKLHLTLSGADNDIDAVGPTPVQLLARDPRAVFTWPQSSANRMGLAEVRAAAEAGGGLTLSADAYWRGFDQRLTDGNTTDVVPCVNDAAQLCLEGADLYPGDALTDAAGRRVPASVLGPGATPAEIDLTHTATDAEGAAWQAQEARPLLGHGNSLVAGAALDHAQTRYAAYGELGTIRPDLEVIGAGVVIDEDQNPGAQPPIEAPVAVSAANTYLGLYATDVLDLTQRLSVSLSGRWNLADIDLAGVGSPLAVNRHAYQRLDPGVGATWRPIAGLTLYAGYAEASRAPTPAELSCANPLQPCILDAFLIADPALKQVVARNLEAGLRGAGRTPWPGGRLVWTLSLFRNETSNDILLLATQLNGFGYFQNAGATLRQGLDASLSYEDRRWRIVASYAYLSATFESVETLASDSPAAGAAGEILVRPGDVLPMSPAERATLSADYQLTGRWMMGADLRAQGSQFLVGDQSNQEPPLSGFAVLALRTRYRLGPRLELYADVENLLGARYATFGTFTTLDGLPPGLGLTNPRSVSPGEPRAITVGARFRIG